LPDHTNVLVIMADQHSPRVLGAAGDPYAITPNLDALAGAGTRFSRAYCTSPICVPSRASFATGRYPHDIGAWDNSLPYSGAEADSWGTRLEDAGHPVTTIGKLHFRAVEDPSGFGDQRLPLHVVDGEGDLNGSLRDHEPVSHASRELILAAGVGESSYTAYDRAIATAAESWLRDEAQDRANGWTLYVSFVTPHYPLTVPAEYFAPFAERELPHPIGGDPSEWSMHPAHVHQRHQADHDEPFTTEQIQNAVRAYYGLVSFMDAQVGRVLRALEDAGLRDTTRIIYTSDHGESLGAHGLWWKSSMYEGSVGVPMLVAGPGVPVGKTSGTPVSIVDVYPSILDAMSVPLQPADADLPGESLWSLAAAEDRSRIVFSEFHAAYSRRGAFMVADDRYKYCYYVEAEPLLFDLIEDPDECRNLAADPAHADVLARMDAALRAILDPDQTDRRARADQAARVEEHGGIERVLAGSTDMAYTPAPTLDDLL
jgi:choline-sulfatase